MPSGGDTIRRTVVKLFAVAFRQTESGTVRANRTSPVRRRRRSSRRPVDVVGISRRRVAVGEKVPRPDRRHVTTTPASASAVASAAADVSDHNDVVVVAAAAVAGGRSIRQVVADFRRRDVIALEVPGRR